MAMKTQASKRSRRSIWRISLRRKGEAAGHYVQTQRQDRIPVVGETVSVRVVADRRVFLALVESMEVQKSQAGVTVYALEVAELDRIAGRAELKTGH